MLNQTLRLFLLNKSPHIIVIEKMGSALSQVMQQVKIKISGSCLL